MRRQGQAVTKGCDARAGQRAAREESEGSDLRVRNVTVIATRKVDQLMDGAWDTVVTSGGKGTFLIRRRKDRLSSQCPLLCYEVRRIDVGGHSGQCDRPEHDRESDGQSGDEGIARRPAAVTVSARASDSPQWGCPQR
jgi:hypothetical protein